MPDPTSEVRHVAQPRRCTRPHRAVTGLVHECNRRPGHDSWCRCRCGLALPDAQPCPHVQTSDEGTSHCGLAASVVRHLEAEIERLRERLSKAVTR